MTARPGRLHVIIESTTLVYDSDGALRSFTRTGADAVSVTYDQDAVGRRIARRVGGSVMARWLYRGIHPVAEYDGAWVLQRVFVYGTRGHVPDYVLASEGGTWVPYRVVTDHLGSVRRVVRVSDGAVVQRMSYDAYGRVLADEVASGWSALPFGYAGGLYDRDTQLVRFGARDYDAETGRWTAKDPIGFNGGDGNLFGYAGMDPVDNNDPEGLTILRFYIGDGLLSIDREDGSRAFSIPAWSGRNGNVVFTCLNNPSPECQRHRDVGPLPLGHYTIHTSRISNPGWAGDTQNCVLSHNRGDWSVPLEPDANVDVMDDGVPPARRGHFLLHGSIRNQSAGCIAIGGGCYGDANTARVLAALLADRDGVVDVFVFPQVARR